MLISLHAHICKCHNQVVVDKIVNEPADLDLLDIDVEGQSVDDLIFVDAGIVV
jgi:hypothetical protein